MTTPSERSDGLTPDEAAYEARQAFGAGVVMGCLFLGGIVVAVAILFESCGWRIP